MQSNPSRQALLGARVIVWGVRHERARHPRPHACVERVKTPINGRAWHGFGDQRNRRSRQSEWKDFIQKGLRAYWADEVAAHTESFEQPLKSYLTDGC